MKASESSQSAQGARDPVLLLRLPEVIRRTGKSRSVIYRDIAVGTFPAPVKIGDRSSAWPSPAVEKWIAERIASQGQAA